MRSGPFAWYAARAKEFGVAPDRIGVWGFSAGGHLASTVGTHFDAATTSDPIDAVSSRPDFHDPGLPGDLFHYAVHAQGIAEESLGRQSGSSAGGEPFERTTGECENSRPRSSSAPMRIPGFPRRTRCCSISRSARRAFPRKFTSFKTAPMAWVLVRATWRWRNGQSRWQIGFASAV